MDWRDWHDNYDRPGSRHARRLRVVQRRLREVLDDSPSGPLRVVSLCAGQGRDLLGVLPGHPRRDDVRARLVELDEENAAAARPSAAGLSGVDVVVGDAAVTDHYADMAPAHLVLVCGVFGNVTDADIRRTVGASNAGGCRTPAEEFGVGVHRFTGRPAPLVLGERMFTFVGYDALRGTT